MAAPAYTEEMDGEPQAEAPAFDIATAPQSANLAFDLDDSTLASMGRKVVEEYGIDLASRAEYDERLKQALSLATLAREAKNTPWENASNVKFPLIIQAAIQFNARSYAALVDGPSIVKGKVLGQASPEKAARADRIGKHMSYQLLEEMEEWEEDTDALLLRLAIVGTLVRKTYFDPALGRNCSHVLGPDEFVVNYHAKRDLSCVPRQTHVLQFYPHEVLEKQRAGLWVNVDLGRSAEAANDDQAPHVFLEQHRLWDMDEDGYPEPYIVTVHKETEKVVRVVARWYEDGVQENSKGEVARITPYECFTKYGFIPSPDGSFYDIGFGTLLGPLSDTINTSINQLMDAATLSNMQGGFIGEGVSIKSGNLKFRPGEWKKAGSAGGVLRDSIVPLPVREPSNVLFSLMQFLVETSRDLTATQDILTGDTGKSTTPVGTTLALIEQGLKTFTAIVKRLHRSLKRELGVLYRLNGRYLNEEEYFQFQDSEQRTGKADYATDDIDVVPVSDPTMATDMQKMGRAQFLLGLRGSGLNDMEINKRALEAASIPDIPALMPDGPPPPNPEVEFRKRELDIREREVAIKDNAEAAKMQKMEAEIANIVAQAMNTQMQTTLAGPQFQLAVAQAIQQARAQLTSDVETEAPNGGPPVRPEDVPGMAPAPADPALPPVPEGPALPPDGAMGLGGDVGPAAPDEGPLDGGIGGPGVG